MRHLLAWASALVVAAGWPAGPVRAQAASGVTFTPYASAQETLTDNYLLSGTDKLADAVTSLTAGVSMRSRSGRVRGLLDYSLTGLVFASHGDQNGFQNRLTADVDTEWYENQGFLRATASIQQVARSAFDAAPRADGLPGGNTTELRTFSLAPRWQGFLGRSLRGSVQAVGSYSNAGNDSAGNVRSGLVSAHIEPTQRALLSWALDASGSEASYSVSGSSRSVRAYGTAYLNLIDLDLQLSTQAGLERSNLTSVQTKDSTTWGLGLQWTPSPRTKLDAQLGQRSFGKTHQVVFEYRTPRTVWQVSSGRDINTGASSLVAGQPGRAFDLLFAQFASIEPDLALRTDLVIDALRRNGWGPNDLINSNFLRTAATVDDRVVLSSLWRGQRTSAALSYALTNSRRANLSVTGLDNLDVSGEVRQRVLSFLLSHRLTPEMTASLSATHQTGSGTLPGQSSRQNGLTAQVAGQLGPKDSWSLAARHTRYETSLVPYAESALVATYGVRF